MDFLPNEKKFIFTLLDTLLMLGAIACIVTIDRGQWILSNPAFYQPGEESLMGNSIMLNAQVGRDQQDKLIPQTGTGCLTGSKSEAWHDTYRSLTVFHSVDQELVPQKGVSVAMARCEG